MIEPSIAVETLVGRVHEGNCIECMSRLPAGSIDLVFADPPFNIGYDYDVYEDSRDRQDYLVWSKEWIQAVHRVLKEDGTFWLAIGDEYAAELKLISQEVGFHTRSWVIWYYTFGVNCKLKFSRSHAHLFYFTKHPEEFTFRAEELENRIPSARQLVYGDKRANPQGRLPDDTWLLRPQDLADCFTTAEDTWYFPRVAGTFKERAGFHGCQMPEQLLGRIVRLCSSPGDVVLDPFCGSGTTTAVAKKLGRLPLGFDLSSEYVVRSNDRLQSIRPGDPLDGAAEPTMSAPATPKKGTGRAGSAVNRQRANQELLFPDDEEVAPEASRPEEYAEAIVEAFRNASQGYSVDRLITDPTLYRSFAEECQRARLAGGPKRWNQTLFMLRKSGRLIDVPTSMRSEIRWEECDPYLYGSEIAWRLLVDRGCDGLDEILCDPELVSEFDRVAMALAPGFTAWQYRWAALKLRKERKVSRTRAEMLELPEFSASHGVDESLWRVLPDAPAVYLVSTDLDGTVLYAGVTLRIRDRARRQFAAAALGWWREQAGTDALQFRFAITPANTSDLLARQVAVVNSWQPRLNLPAQQ